MADHISDVAGHVVVVNRSPLRLAWDTHFVGDLRAVNNNFLDMVRLKSNHSVENWAPISARRLTGADAETAAPSASATCGRAKEEPFKWAVRLRARDGIEFDFIADEVRVLLFFSLGGGRFGEVERMERMNRIPRPA